MDSMCCRCGVRKEIVKFEAWQLHIEYGSYCITKVLMIKKLIASHEVRYTHRMMDF